MCLITFAFDAHPTYALVFAGNRDEAYDRPTAAAHYWDDAPDVLAGRDLKAGGTWLGVTRDGRWAAITNVRDPSARIDDAPSRGHLVSEFLTGEAPPAAYLRRVAARGEQYNGFNLLVGTMATCWYYSNRDGSPRRVVPGAHGLSNATLDTPWPKVERSTARLDAALDDAGNGRVDPDRLLDLLDDRRCAPDDALPDTGVGRELERVLSPIFIETDGYGTRASSVLLIRRDGHVTFVERTFNGGTATGTRSFAFDTTPATTE